MEKLEVKRKCSNPVTITLDLGHQGDGPSNGGTMHQRVMNNVNPTWIIIAVCILEDRHCPYHP